MALYRDGPPAKAIQLLVHMLPGDQCTRFAIPKMTHNQGMSHLPRRKMHSLSLLATENATETNFRLRLTYERGTAPHSSTNGRSSRVAGPSTMASCDMISAYDVELSTCRGLEGLARPDKDHGHKNTSA